MSNRIVKEVFGTLYSMVTSLDDSNLRQGSVNDAGLPCYQLVVCSNEYNAKAKLAEIKFINTVFLKKLKWFPRVNLFIHMFYDEWLRSIEEHNARMRRDVIVANENFLRKYGASMTERATKEFKGLYLVGKTQVQPD